MLGEIEEVLAHGRGTTCLSLKNAGRIWIDPASGTYCTSLLLPEVFFRTAMGTAKVTREEAPFGTHRFRPIDELLYQAAYHGAHGVLLDRCQPYDVVELKSWPNFTRLPHTRHMVTLCSLLSRRPTSLSFAYRMLKIPEAEAFRFCSAVNAAGHVRVISSQPASTRSEIGSASVHGSDDARATSFWSRLFERFAGL